MSLISHNHESELVRGGTRVIVENLLMGVSAVFVLVCGSILI